MSVDTTGIQELIMTILTAIATFDIKTIDMSFVNPLLSMFAPVLKPFWESVSQILTELFGW